MTLAWITRGTDTQWPQLTSSKKSNLESFYLWGSPLFDSTSERMARRAIGTESEPRQPAEGR